MSLLSKAVYKHPPDGEWGAPQENGSWSGMIGMLHRGEAEIAVGPFTVTWARSLASNFSIPLVMDSKSLMMQRPRIFNDVFGFLNPFTYHVYAAVFICLILIAMFLKLMVFSESTLLGKKGDISFGNSLMWAVKTILQEATKTIPQSNGRRVIIGTWLLCTFIIIKSYEGTLTAMLTVPKVEILVDSIEDLAIQDRYSWKLEKGSSSYLYFQESESELHKYIFRNKNGTFSSCFKSCESIARGEFVGICDLITIKKCMHWDFSMQNECNIYAGRTPVLAGVSIAMAFQINSPLREEANKWIERLLQAGIFDKWLRDEMTNSSQCLVPPTKDRHSTNSIVFSLENFSGSFFLLITGTMVSFLALLMEITYNYLSRK